MKLKKYATHPALGTDPGHRLQFLPIVKASQVTKHFWILDCPAFTDLNSSMAFVDCSSMIIGVSRVITALQIVE